MMRSAFAGSDRIMEETDDSVAHVVVTCVVACQLSAEVFLFLSCYRSRTVAAGVGQVVERRVCLSSPVTFRLPLLSFTGSR